MLFTVLFHQVIVCGECSCCAVAEPEDTSLDALFVCFVFSRFAENRQVDESVTSFEYAVIMYNKFSV